MSERHSDHFVAPVDENEALEVDQVRLGERRSNLWIDAWRDLRRRPLFYVALVIVSVVALAAAWPSLFTNVDPQYCELSLSNNGPAGGHPLGFTRQGCDVYSRVVWGARTSLSVGLLVTLITAVIGIPMGALAGFFGGAIDSVLSRIGD